MVVVVVGGGGSGGGVGNGGGGCSEQRPHQSVRQTRSGWGERGRKRVVGTCRKRGRE